MSLINQILGQQVVILTIGLAALMLFAAVILAMLPRLKASRARRAKLKAQRAAEALALANQEIDDAEQEELAARARVRAQMSGDEAGDEEKSGKGSKAAKSPAASKPISPAPAAPKPTIAGADQAKPEDKKDEPTPEMQDLLSSVFSDEESAERQAKLMKGVENVEIDHLVTLCNTVMAQVRGENPTNVVKIKENQLQ